VEGNYLDDSGEERQAFGDVLLDESGGKYSYLGDNVEEGKGTSR
jgi:hypothetical protein